MCAVAFVGVRSPSRARLGSLNGGCLEDDATSLSCHNMLLNGLFLITLPKSAVDPAVSEPQPHRLKFKCLRDCSVGEADVWPSEGSESRNAESSTSSRSIVCAGGSSGEVVSSEEDKSWNEG